MSEGFAPCHKRVVVLLDRAAVWYDNSTCSHNGERIGFVIQAGRFDGYGADQDHPECKVVLVYQNAVAVSSWPGDGFCAGDPDEAWVRAEHWVRTGELP